MRTRPVIALLGIVVGATLAVVLWKGWRGLADRLALGQAGEGVESGGPGLRSAHPSEGGAPAQSIATPPFQPIPAPMPFGTVFDPLAAVDDAPALYDEVQETGEDELASTMHEIDEASNVAPPGQSPTAPDTSVAPPEPSETRATLRARFGPNAAAPIERGVCPDDFPVKGNANSMIYHLPGQSTYTATIPEVCFRDAAAAEAAGFRARKR